MYLLLLAPVSTQWSPCTPTCGSGLQSTVREGARVYRACVLPPCPVLSATDSKCSLHVQSLDQETRLLHPEWESSPSTEHPCQLYCNPVGHQELRQRGNDSLMNGAICGHGKLSICLAGQCEVQVANKG